MQYWQMMQDNIVNFFNSDTGVQNVKENNF